MAVHWIQEHWQKKRAFEQKVFADFHQKHNPYELAISTQCNKNELTVWVKVALPLTILY